MQQIFVEHALLDAHSYYFIPYLKYLRGLLNPILTTAEIIEKGDVVWRIYVRQRLIELPELDYADLSCFKWYYLPSQCLDEMAEVRLGLTR
jgi:hypothetical protein